MNTQTQLLLLLAELVRVETLTTLDAERLANLVYAVRKEAEAEARHAQQCQEVAEEITRLRAEIERIRRLRSKI